MIYVNGAPVDITTNATSTTTVSPLVTTVPLNSISPLRPNQLGEEAVKDELSSHFGVEEKALENIESLLLKLKEKTHKKVFGNRVFSRDVRFTNTYCLQ